MIYMFSFLIVVSVHCQTCVIEPIKVECNFNFTYQTFALKVHSHNHLLSNNNIIKIILILLAIVS